MQTLLHLLHATTERHSASTTQYAHVNIFRQSKPFGCNASAAQHCNYCFHCFISTEIWLVRFAQGCIDNSQPFPQQQQFVMLVTAE